MTRTLPCTSCSQEMERPRDDVAQSLGREASGTECRGSPVFVAKGFLSSIFQNCRLAATSLAQ